MIFRVNITGLLRRQNYESGGGEWGPFRESNRECIVKVDSKKGYKNIASMNLYTECPVKLFPLGYLLFCRLLLMQIAKVGSCMKNSGNLVQDRHKNFEN